MSDNPTVVEQRRWFADEKGSATECVPLPGIYCAPFLLLRSYSLLSWQGSPVM